MRTVPAPFVGCIDLASALETSPDSGIWKVGDAFYSGQVSSATSTTLSIASPDWAPYQWHGQNYFVSILSGTGAGQRRIITTNSSATQLTLTSAWTTIPDSTSTFEIRGLYTGDGTHPLETGAYAGGELSPAVITYYGTPEPTIPPTVTIDQTACQADPTHSSPIDFTVVFSKPVDDFATGDVTLGGTAGATTAIVTDPSGDDIHYNVAVIGMSGSGTVIASIAAGVAHDAADNPNLASTSTDDSVLYDITPPTSRVNALARVQSSLSFVVSVAGSDRRPEWELPVTMCS